MCYRPTNNNEIIKKLENYNAVLSFEIVNRFKNSPSSLAGIKFFCRSWQTFMTNQLSKTEEFYSNSIQNGPAGIKDLQQKLHKFGTSTHSKINTILAQLQKNKKKNSFQPVIYKKDRYITEVAVIKRSKQIITLLRKHHYELNQILEQDDFTELYSEMNELEKIWRKLFKNRQSAYKHTQTIESLQDEALASSQIMKSIQKLPTTQTTILSPTLHTQSTPVFYKPRHHYLGKWISTFSIITICTLFLGYFKRKSDLLMDSS